MMETSHKQHWIENENLQNCVLISSFVQFFILYPMLFVQGFHHFCVLSYLNFKKGSNFKISKET
jgi:hypothetical protein